MINREHRCSECLQLQDKEMEYPYVCEGCEEEQDREEVEVKIGRAYEIVYPDGSKNELNGFKVIL